MEQLKIWDHFQDTDGAAGVFANAIPRYEFISKSISPGMSVLNIGVGHGGLEKILLAKGALVCSLDPSESAIVRLRKSHQLGERAQVGFSQTIPFPDCEFEVVVMSEVLEHLSDDVLTSTLLEVRRVLKPDGRFIGTVPANENLRDNFAICPRCGESFHRWGHVQSFSLSRLNNLLSENAFMVNRIEIRAFPDWRRFGFTGFIKNSTRYILGRLGSPIASPNIYFEARSSMR